MELTQTIKAHARVCVTLEETGELSVKVFAQAEYAPGKGTTAEVSGNDVPDDVRAEIRAACEWALTGAQKQLGERLGKAIHKSAEVAAAHGELS